MKFLRYEIFPPQTSRISKFSYFKIKNVVFEVFEFHGFRVPTRLRILEFAYFRISIFPEFPCLSNFHIFKVFHISKYFVWRVFKNLRISKYPCLKFTNISIYSWICELSGFQVFRYFQISRDIGEFLATAIISILGPRWVDPFCRKKQ